MLLTIVNAGRKAGTEFWRPLPCQESLHLVSRSQGEPVGLESGVGSWGNWCVYVSGGGSWQQLFTSKFNIDVCVCVVQEF